MIPQTKLSLTKEQLLQDYRLVFRSRQASLVGRREVLTGKAKFGIFGDGKELPQIAMAKFFRPGDFRSGYYRDQTLMLALGEYSLQQYFAQLYADASTEREPASGGRQMNAHFGTRLLDRDGRWIDLTKKPQSSIDLSPTGSQMPRLVGLAYASRLYRELRSLDSLKGFSDRGNEVAFGTIGNASAAEGMFWESLNAISVLKSPAVISVWDDDYGISVSNQHQFGKDLGDILRGFERVKGEEFGYRVYTVRGWDYPELLRTYQEAIEEARQEHIPALIHVIELTQPQGHSTSGSHERYKSAHRLVWEKEHDCLAKFKQWIIDGGDIGESELDEIEVEEVKYVEISRREAWENSKQPIHEQRDELLSLIRNEPQIPEKVKRAVIDELGTPANLQLRDLVEQAARLLRDLGLPVGSKVRQDLIGFKNMVTAEARTTFGSYLHSESDERAMLITGVAPEYGESSPLLNGFEILNRGFDKILERDPRVIAFGEDLGKIGGVNQGFAGLQEKYGDLRVTDTGIREATIVGQAIGMAMRGLRPIAEIQYLDYILYALQILSDDLATVQWRSAGGQKAPVIIRTRGHRLEGVWHSGSQMGGLLNLLRGIYLLVPRNMVQAIGFYNSLLLSDEPGIVVEVLNAYRQKERLPANLGDFRVPIGIPEIIRPGRDLTVVTYGAMCRIVVDAAEELASLGIDTEVVDVRSLLPMDKSGVIMDSIKRTNRVLFADEDVPGGATAYMMQHVLEGQGGYAWLDSPPKTLTATAHRPPYGSDGNYFSKPSVESVIETVYEMMREARPSRHPGLF
jgi:pyruvate/2-oxoglutarate/acetoin dehydrogenase E1 component/TPP-dependent pyruvate/acetoin dehydrogenase alpha subunit